MERIGTVETICRYPVKSMAGEDVTQAFVGFAGLMGDRALLSSARQGPKASPAHRARAGGSGPVPPALPRERSRDLAPDIEETFKMAPGVNPIFPAEDAFEIDVGTPDGRTLPLRSPELKAMIEQRAGMPLRSGLVSAASMIADRSRCSQRLSQRARGRARHADRPSPLSGQPLCWTGRTTGRTGRTSWSDGRSRSGAAAPRRPRA